MQINNFDKWERCKIVSVAAAARAGARRIFALYSGYQIVWKMFLSITDAPFLSVISVCQMKMHNGVRQRATQEKIQKRLGVLPCENKVRFNTNYSEKKLSCQLFSTSLHPSPMHLFCQLFQNAKWRCIMLFSREQRMMSQELYHPFCGCHWHSLV
jgi:hypothetical protein